MSIEKTLNDLDRVAFRLKAGTVKALRAATKDAEKHAKATSLFNDRSGDTRRSIEAKFIVNGTSTTTELVAEGASFFLENGTKFMEARPFMTEARDFGERSLDFYIEIFVNEAILD